MAPRNEDGESREGGLHIVSNQDEPPLLAPPAVLDEVRQRMELESVSRREQCLSLLIAGLTSAQIAQQLNISVAGVEDLTRRALRARKTPSADDYRTLENLRLDRAQAAIWPQVLQGDLKAADLYLRISQRRAKLNGLDAPLAVSVSVNVRQEMRVALQELENVVLGYVQGEVLSDGSTG